MAIILNVEVSLLAAIGLGALHSLEPGHGKGVMSAYIVSSRANALQSMLLGIVSSVSHAFSIFLIATIMTLSINLVTPAHLIFWLDIISGLFIIIIGSSRLIKQFRTEIVTVRKWSPVAAGSHFHDHTEHHHDHHFHYHPKQQPKNLFQFFSVGFLTGIIPCPSALAIILAAISAHHLLIGIKLVFAFSIGGAFTMATLGYLISHANQRVNTTDHLSFIRFINILSAILIIALGMGILYTSFLGM